MDKNLEFILNKLNKAEEEQLAQIWGSERDNKNEDSNLEREQ